MDEQVLKLNIFFLMFLIFFVSCASGDTVTIITDDTEIIVTVEIADTLDEQALGLMYRKELAPDHGMLFVFEDEKQRIFWMKNTEIPLDILFIDQNNMIIDIKENFEPCIVEACEKYYSKPAMYVLEVNAGFVEEHGIVVGESVVIEVA